MVKHKKYNQKKLEKFLNKEWIELKPEMFDHLLALCKNYRVILDCDEDGIKNNDMNLVIKLRLPNI